MRKPLFYVTFAFALIPFLLADVAMAQPERGRQTRDGGFGMDFGGGGSLALLNSERVQQELELLDDQIEELRALQETARSAMRDLFAEMEDVSPEDRREMMQGMREKMQERMAGFQEEIDSVLLPHQRDRLKQLTFQSEGRFRGVGGALNSQSLLDELGVTGEQREKLNEAVQKAREELQKKYAELVREAEDEVLGVLTREQREQYRKLVGEPFEFETPGAGRERGERGQRGGERGQRGERGRDRQGDGNRSDF